IQSSKTFHYIIKLFCKRSTSGPGLSSWFRLQAKLSHDFRDNVWQLAKTRKQLYEDGENFVLDLETKL
ncbi:hypothetical protein QT970_27400, partial [Microcoleus sp. herbarium8]|uniref:hypothetical protein n=1 Tax=Microcoleus sp. herbarium8 TaxID=3055436 RepID=UPI002FD6CF92